MGLMASPDRCPGKTVEAGALASSHQNYEYSPPVSIEHVPANTGVGVLRGIKSRTGVFDNDEHSAVILHADADTNGLVGI